MEPRRTRFYRDKQHGKISGVCAGLADYTGIDTAWIRIGMIVLFMTLGWPIFAYFVVAWATPVKPVDFYTGPDQQRFWQGVRANPSRSAREVRASFRDLDRRLADIELFYTSRNKRLEDEIEALR